MTTGSTRVLILFEFNLEFWGELVLCDHLLSFSTPPSNLDIEMQG